MVPLLNDGDSIYVEWSPSSFEPGALVLARDASSEWLVHRLITESDRLWVTRGDASVVWETLPPEAVFGRVVGIRGRSYPTRVLDRWIAWVQRKFLFEDRYPNALIRRVVKFLATLRKLWPERQVIE